MPSKEAIALREALMKLRPLVIEQNIVTGRKMQDRLGKLAVAVKRVEAEAEDLNIGPYMASMLTPAGVTDRERCVLYLHGGAYVMGGIDYAKGFGGTIAMEVNTRVLCVAYRLAPESPYPAALEDALSAYDYLLSQGYRGEDIALCGESAGGGLVFCLSLMLKRLKREMPGAIVALSPWTDLTCSGATYEQNADTDPTIDRGMLIFYRGLYARGKERDPLVSPLFGELGGLPPTLILAGGGEMLLDDSRLMAARLRQAGVDVELNVEPGMWHVYPLYGAPEGKAAMKLIKEFLSRIGYE